MRRSVPSPGIFFRASFERRGEAMMILPKKSGSISVLRLESAHAGSTVLRERMTTVANAAVLASVRPLRATVVAIRRGSVDGPRDDKEGHSEQASSVVRQQEKRR